MTDLPAGGDIAQEEDRALFKTYGGPIAVSLVPQVHRTLTGDVLVRGYFDATTEIFLLIAGRRAREAKALEARLKGLHEGANGAAVRAGKPLPSVNQIRLPLQVKGTWRQKFWREEDGSDVRTHQLVAARWAYKDRTGALVQFGMAPAVVRTPQRRAKSYILQTREIDAVPVTFHREKADGA